ncbi:MAG: protein phosphatase protein [Clostridia bacterium]|nr:protein phosphatase protein [Clostridia bacterium]
MTWSAIGECVTGSSHIRNKKPCQDALKIYHMQELGVICTLADGHGSQKCLYSDDGAEIAVAATLSIIETIVWHHKEEELYSVMRSIKDVVLPKNIEREWKAQVKAFHEHKKREAAASDKALYELYGTTLMLLFVTKQFIFAMQIGDGDILTVFDNGETSWLIEPEVQYGTETYSLCLTNSWKYFKNQLIPISQYTILPRLFLASTDGYANSFISSGEFLKIGKDYLDIVKENQIDTIQTHLKEWLMHTSSSGSGDDITFVMIYNNDSDLFCGG